jgi:intracellular sulfur oxidation DsrE/DsrF family protein
MKKILFIAMVLFLNTAVFGQAKESSINVISTSEIKQEPRKIVMQLTSADTNVHKMLVKQLNNIISVAPDTRIEVVCHGPGLSLLVKDKTTVSKQIESSALKSVDFVACSFSMKERNVKKEDLLQLTKIVEAGIIEIVDKQYLGWAYIKAGN